MFVKSTLIIVLLLGLSYVSFSISPRHYARDSNTELLFVFSISRHGARTPESEELRVFRDHPSVNFSENSYHPYGFGALTNIGKRRGYEIGNYLKKRYDGFISKIYRPEEVTIRSSDRARTKMTAQLVTAALYRPTDTVLDWSDDLKLDWQPVPYDTVPAAMDPLTPSTSCPKYSRLVKMQFFPEYLPGRSRAEYFIELVSNMSGLDLGTLREVLFLISIVEAEANYGIPKPAWAEENWKVLKKIEGEIFLGFVANDEMIRLAGGTVLDEFTSRSSAIVTGETVSPSKLLYISGHDNNVVSIMAAIGVLETHRPDYTAVFSLELRKNSTSGEFSVAALYAATATDDAVALPMAWCGGRVLCPLPQFLELTERYRLPVADFQVACTL